jgi:hypothetical protein
MLVSLDIQKYLRGEYWTNRYILDIASTSAGSVPAGQIVTAERSITIVDVQFVSYRISSIATGDDDYVVVPLETPGQRAISTQALPLFDVLRVDFGVGQGRPSRKYLRGVLSEQDQTNYGELEASAQTFFSTNYGQPVAAVPEYVDVDGQPILTSSVFKSVGMRQLRRGTKRRLQPIIPLA